MSEQYHCKWKNHMNIMKEFKNYLSVEGMVDVTLTCEGLSLKAHKTILSASSPFFRSLFLENPCKHPIVMLEDIKYAELKSIIEFIYCGKFDNCNDQLSTVIRTAQALKVKGLGEIDSPNNQSGDESQNQSGGELLHQSICSMEPSNQARKMQRLLLNGQNNNRISELEIHIKEISDNNNCGVSKMPVLSHRKNPLLESELEQPFKQNCVKNIILQESFHNAAQNLLTENLETDCEEWNNYINIMTELRNFLSVEAMVDVTLACEGQSLKAHKIVLSACSSFFKSLFLDNSCKHPIVILRNIKFADLKVIIDFMYHGEINISKDQLSSVMKTAQILKIKGLRKLSLQNCMSDDGSKDVSDVGVESENLSSDESENLFNDELENLSDDELKNLSNDELGNLFSDKFEDQSIDELENPSDDELSHQPMCNVDVSNWTCIQKQLVNNNESCTLEIKEEMLPDDQNRSNVSAKPLQSHSAKSLNKSQNSLSSDESENHSSSELSNRANYTIDISHQNFRQKQSLHSQNNSRSYEPIIKQENLSFDMNCDDSCSNGLTEPLQSNCTSLVFKCEQEQPVRKSCDKGFAFQKNFQASKSHSLGETLEADGLSNQSSESCMQSNMELPQDTRISANLIVLVERIDVSSDVLVGDNQRSTKSPVSCSERSQKKAETKKIPERSVRQPRYLEEYEVSNESDLRSKKARTNIKKSRRTEASLTKPEELQKKELKKEDELQKNDELKKKELQRKDLQKKDELQKKSELEIPSKMIRRRQSRGLTDGSGQKLLYKVENSPSGIRFFICEKCTFKTRYPESLRRHSKARHENQKNFKCDQCPYAAVHRQNLTRHIEQVHEHLIRFHCSLCPYKCCQIGDLKRHIQCIHVGDKRYKCEKCDFRSVHKGSVKKHFIAIHEQRRDHTCNFCLYRCSAKENLKRHVWLMHEKKKMNGIQNDVKNNNAVYLKSPQQNHSNTLM